MANGIIKRYMGLQIPINLTSAGRILFPDVQNLRGANIESVVVLGKNIALRSVQSGNSGVMEYDDFAISTLTFVKGSDEVISQICPLQLMPYRNGTTNANGNPNAYIREIFNDIPLDWNKCYIQFWDTPQSDTTFYLNLGVYYYYPETK